MACAVAPVGDPDYARLRAAIALPTTGEDAGLPLDGFFALNAAMPALHALYQKREALILHAVHSPYRGRSHFDGQDVLESGLAGTGRIEDGWLNRALLQLPAAGKANPRGLAIGAVVPLLMRGKAPALSWIPKVSNLPLRDSTIARLMDLYAETDPVLAKAFAEGMEISRVADADAPTSAPATRSRRPPPSSRRPSFLQQDSIGSSPRLPRLPPSSCRRRRARASACSATTAGTRMPTRGPSRASWRCG
jgi:uncharacterized protein (DUF1501 family)